MKFRLIIFLTVVSLLCSYLCVPVFADESNIVPVEGSAELLSVLDIVPDTTGYEEVVSRADFAVWAARIQKVNDYLPASERYYTDVEMGHWAANAVNSLASAGILTVGQDKKFRPNDDITAAEAIKMLVVMMGYREPAEYEGGFPTGYMAVAKKAGLLENVVYGETLSKADACNLLYNGLTSEMFSLESVLVSEDGSYVEKSKNGETLLSFYWDIYEVKGFVTGDFGATVEGISAEEENALIIGKEKFICGDGVNCKDMIGRYVCGFYRQEKRDDEKVLVVLNEEADCGETVFIDASQLSVSSTTAIKYYDESDRERSGSFDANTAVIYNGVLVKNIGKVLNTNGDKFTNGSFRLCDTDDNGRFDIAVVNEYYNIFVGAVDSAKKLVYDEYAPASVFAELEENKVDFLEITDDNDNEKSFENIKSGILISVYDSKDYNDGKRMIKVRICSETVSGKIEKIVKDEVTVSGQVYKLDKNFAKNYPERIKTGDNSKLFIDVSGRVAACIATSASDMSYGYLVDYLEDGVFEKTVKLKIFDSKGKMGIYPCGSRVRIDGKTTKNSAEIIEALAKGKAGISGQLIRFSLNDEALVVRIDTNYDAIGENEYSLYTYAEEMSRGYMYYASQLGMDIVLNGSVKIFGVPADDKLEKSEDSDFTVINNSQLNESTLNNSQLLSSAYAADKNAGFPDVVLLKGSVHETDGKKGLTMLVTEISEVVNGDGSVVERISGYNDDGVECSFDAAENVTLSDSLQPGDLAVLRRNISGEIIGIWTLIFDGDKMTSSPVNGLLWGDTSWNLGFSGGYAVSSQKDVLCIGYNGADRISERVNLAGKNVVIYDYSVNRGSKAEVTSAGGIKTERLMPGSGDRVVVCRNNQNVQGVFVWRR